MLRRFMHNYRNRKSIIEEEGIKSYLINDRGYILLIVLLISAFLVSFTSDFFLSTHTYIAYIRRMKSDINSEFLSYSGFEIAKAILDVDRLGLSGSFMSSLSSDRNIDSYKDIWALDFPEIPVDDYDIKIQIDDENSKIFINALSIDAVPTPHYYFLQRFLMNMGLSLDISDSILDWTDPDDTRFGSGGESSTYYLNRIPAYPAKNAPLDSIDELLLVKDMTPEIFYGIGGGNFGLEKNLVDDNKGDVTIPLYKIEEFARKSSDKKTAADTENDEKIQRPIGREKSRKLSSYLRVNGNPNDFTDSANQININTASFRVLASLSDDMTDDVVENLIRQRQLKPFASVAEIKSFISDTQYERLAKYLTVKSGVFKITVTVKNDNSFCKTLYYFDRDNKKLIYCSMGH